MRLKTDVYTIPLIRTIVILLIISSMTCVFAQEPSAFDTLLIENAAARQGETVSVHINMVNTIGIGGFSMRFTYDSSVIRPVAILLVDEASLFDLTVADTGQSGVIRIIGVSDDPFTLNISAGRGHIANIGFYLLADAAVGHSSIRFENSGPETFENSISDTTGQRLIIPTLIDGYINVELSSLIGRGDMLPVSDIMMKNYPNPFNSSTLISFYLESNNRAIMKIYDILGRNVRIFNYGFIGPGDFAFTWDGRDNSQKEVSSGIYCYSLYLDDFQVCKKRMVLLR
jgi:hypothetical protein